MKKPSGQLVLLLLLACGVQSACASGFTWPANQFLPTFSTPAATIECIDVDPLPNDEKTLFCSLEGLVNRTQPRLACVSAASEGKFTWLNIHNLPYTTLSSPFSAILTYITNVTGLVVYDTNLMDTLNLATTIAGVKNELICDSNLMVMLTNAPYNLSVKDDLRGKFSNKYQVYGYLYTNYWPQCNHRLIAGLETNEYWYLRDYLVATKAAVVWLDPGGVSADATALAPFISSMTPVGGVYLGWWPNEGPDLNWIGPYGIPVMASDLFDNATVYGGVASQISVPAIPPTPTLQNKVYVSMTLSDGDNVQYIQHTLYQNWQSSARGQVPLGWTVQPLLADFDPGMLNYFWSTATTNDCLVAGPSGPGYTHIEYWSSANVAAYTAAAGPYLQRTGIRMATVWDTVSIATANAYATNCPTLVGVDDYNDGYYMANDKSLPVAGFPTNGSYAKSVTNLVNAITNAAASWNGTAPMFISVQGDAWEITPADCQTVASSLNASEYVVVRPDHLFLLYRQAVGLGAAGASPCIAAPPASQSAVAGSNVTFSVIASGTGPLSYQWQKNSTNIAGATNSIYIKSNAQITDAGIYSVVVTNNYGTASSGPTNGVLSIITGAPIITSQTPIPVANLTLYSAPLSITAAGNAPLYYRWFANGAPIPGATNTEFTPPAGTQGGVSNYVCIITNVTGSATSAVWSVSVLPTPLASYPQAVLALQPAGYWRLNETPNNGSGNQGVVCHDYVSGNNGVYTNTVLAQPGYEPATDPAETSADFGRYANPNSDVNSIMAPDFSTLNGSNGEFTVTAWVYPTSVAGGNAGIVTKGYFYQEEADLDCGAPNFSFRFAVRNAPGTEFNANSTISTVASGVTNHWYHLVGVCDEANGLVSLYTNGLMAGSAAIPVASGIFDSSGTPMTIGARATSATSGNNNQFVGFVNDVAVFDYALTSKQVQQLYAAAPVPMMNMAPTGNGMAINYTGTLLSSANAAGPYAPVPGAAPPSYVIPATNSQMFYRVNNQ